MSSCFADDIQFQRLLAGEAEVDLVDLLLEFARDSYPSLDPSVSRDAIRQLQDQARDAVAWLGGAAALAERLAEVSRVLYREAGFRGNKDDYYDPRNSCLNIVLQRRLGIPITLGIVYMTVAASCELRVFGVATPGHFMLGAERDGGTLYVDPFDRGQVLSREECLRHVERRLGRQEPLAEQLLRPAHHLEIAARVLRNLKAAYAMRDEWDKMLPVQSRLAMLLPEMSDEQRDLGLVYLRIGRPSEALERFDAYLKVCQPDDAQTLHPYVRSARRMLAERN